jgi:hypothetical protein
MSPEVVAALQRSQKPGGAPPSPAPGPAATGGMMPQKPAGQIEQGKLKMMAAMKLIQIALASFEPGSKEWKTALAMLTSGAKGFGKTEGDVEDLQNSEKKTIAAGMTGPGGAPPQPPPMAPPGGGAAPAMAA